MGARSSPVGSGLEPLKSGSQNGQNPRGDRFQKRIYKYLMFRRDLMREMCIIPTTIIKRKKWRCRKMVNPRPQSGLVLRPNLEPRSQHG